MLVGARLRHVAGTQWGNKKYMNMKHLEAALEDASIAGRLLSHQSLQTKVRKILDTTIVSGTDGFAAVAKLVYYEIWTHT